MGKAVNDITIYQRDGSVRYKLNNYTQLCAIKSAEQKRELLGEDNVTLKITSATPMECSIGDYIIVYGSVYTLNKAGECTKNGERSYEQSYVFEGLQYKLLDAQYRNADAAGHNPTANFSIVANMELLMQVLLTNVNRVAGTLGEVWVLGDCPSTEYREFTYNNQNCLNVLQSACDEFETEFEIVQTSEKHYTLHIRKQGSLLPATFDFSKQSGVYKLRRKNVNSADIVTRLYVEGGTQNIGNGYRDGSERLRLAGESYVQNTEGIAAFGIKEGSKQYDEVYPHRTGKVTAIVEGNGLQFVDSEMFNLNEKEGGNTKYLIDGTSAKVRFTGQSALAGYEFEIHRYDHFTHTFTLVQYEDKRGLKLPDGGAYTISVNDEYVLLDIVMPQDPYVTDAESELRLKAEEELEALSQPRVEYELEIASLSLEKEYGTDEGIVNVFQVGDLLHIKDTDINVDKAIRIKSFTRDCYADPYKYKVTLSDTLDVTLVERLIEDNIRQNEVIALHDLTNIAKARANWRSTQELLNMVFDGDGYFDTENIKPNSIETMMLSVGNRAGQMVLRNVVIEANAIVSGVPQPNVLNVTSYSGILIHYAIEEQDRTWSVQGLSVTLSNNNAYYIYAKCQKNTNTAGIIVSQEKLAVDDGNSNGYYYFLIGVLSSVYNGYRDITLTYGATRITGRTINCGKIESVDGHTYFDLDNSEIGGNIKFRSTGGTLTSVSDAVDGLQNGINSNQTAIDGIAANVSDNSSAIDGLTTQIGQQGQSIEGLNETTELLQEGFSEHGTSITEMQALINGQKQSIVELQELTNQLKGQIDGSIEYWYGTEPPTMSNAPAVNWSGLDEWLEHQGDIYTDTQTGLDYRFSVQYDSGMRNPRGVWTQVASTGIGTAIQTAIQALDIANGKNHMFVTSSFSVQPTSSTYKEGDIWLALDVMQMRVATADGDGVAFKPSDWRDVGYTDDTAANNALAQLSALADDGKVTPAEKIQLKQQMAELAADYAELLTQSQAAGVTTSVFTTYYNTLKNYTDDLLADMTTTSDVNRTTYNTYFSNYYKYRAKQVEKITNSKSRTHCTASASYPPTAMYYEGDLWLMLDTYKIKLCVATRTNDTYKATDWQDAGYTDDTNANAALAQLDAMANDSIISPAEKVTLKDEMSNLTADFVATSAKATSAGCVTTAFEQAYQQLKSYTDDILDDMDSNTSVTKATYNANFAAYYTERANLLAEIAQKIVDNMEIGQGNYIANGAFFTALTGWNYSADSSELYQDSVMGSVMRFGKTNTTDKFLLHTAFRTQQGNLMLPDNAFKAGVKYTLAFWVKGSKAMQMLVGIMEPAGQKPVAPYIPFNITTSWQRIVYTFTATDKSQSDTRLFIRGELSVTFSWLMFTKFVLVEGNKAPEWTDSSREFKAQMEANEQVLTAMRNNYTQIDGGLILSTILKLGAILRSGVYQESAGVKAMLESVDEVAAYFGGTLAEAIDGTKQGMVIIYHNGKFVAMNADIRGKITATTGTIGGFTITENTISGGSGCKLEIGADDFNTQFGITTKGIGITVQANNSYPVMNTYTFAYKENNRLTLKNNTSRKYDWLNIDVANVMAIDYFSSTNSNYVSDGYGYQFAMAGTGHVVLDAIIDGGGCTLLSDFTASNQVTMIQIPLHCNRIAVTTNYDNDIVVLPDYNSMFNTFGYGFAHTQYHKKFTFEITIFNIGSRTIYVAGRNNDIVNGEQYYTGNEMPQLYENGSLKTTLKSVSIGAHQYKKFMLFFHPTYGYQAMCIS